MTTAAEATRSATAEAAKVAWDAARRYLDESASISRNVFSAWAASSQAGLRTAFDLQNAMIQASRIVLDATAQANRAWFDQGAESVRKGQDLTAEAVAAGMDLVQSAMPTPRG